MSVQRFCIALWDTESVELLNEVHVDDISLNCKKDESEPAAAGSI